MDDDRWETRFQLVLMALVSAGAFFMVYRIGLVDGIFWTEVVNAVR